jgi:hypothetical protein
MKNLVLVLALSTVSATAFASSPNIEVCKGASRNGDGITAVLNVDNNTVQINSQGARLTYNMEAKDGGDVAEAYTSQDHGGLKITFYDESQSASGWSQELGAFKLSCQ